jgi:transposase-like protein DUF772
VLLVGYCYGLRSERRLCREISLNLTYRWFCRHVFESVVRRCLAAGLVGGEGLNNDPWCRACR